MYIFKNAFINITRNKGRNILIGIIIMVIAAACSITLSIRNSATKIVTAYEEKYDVEATISMDRKTLMESLSQNDSQEDMIEAFNKIEGLTQEEVDKYGDSKYVKSYYYTYNISMNAKDLTEATDTLMKETTTTKTETSSWQMPFGNMPGPGGPSGYKGGSSKKTTTKKTEKIYNAKADKGAFTVIGYSSYEAMKDFIDGTYTITDGEVSSDFNSNGCVISKELATLNDLKVGDKITLTNPDNSKLTYELEITGIYEENSSESDETNRMFSSSANTIITNVNTISSIKDDDEDMSVTIDPTYLLVNKDVADRFSEEVKKEGLADYYTVTDNVDIVTSATKSIVNVKTFATSFLLITLVIGAVVLLVINMINIRERKYEIGVLRTIGMRKITLVSQFIIELVVVAFFGLLVGAGIGSLSSVKIANSLLATEIKNAQEEQSNIEKNFGGPMDMGRPSMPNDSKKEEATDEEKEDTSKDEEETKSEDTTKTDDTKTKNKNPERINGTVSISQVDKMEAIVDFKVLLELLAIGLGLTLISSISACIAIARFSPLTILKERS